MNIRAILFDVDGTLIDSNDAHARAWHDAFSEAGYAVPIDSVRPLIGMGADTLVPALVPGLCADEGTGHTIGERRKTLFRDRYLPGLLPTRGARELIAALKERGFTVGIATSAQSDELHALLKAAQVDDLIDLAADAGDARAGKPDPNIVDAALAKAGVAPRNALLIGDTPYDVEAAKRAGMAAIALRCGGSSDETLRGAVAIYDDPAQLLESLESSPLATIR